MNTYLSLLITNLALGGRKPDLKLYVNVENLATIGFIKPLFFDLANFSQTFTSITSPLPNPLAIIFLLIGTNCITKKSISIVVNI